MCLYLWVYYHQKKLRFVFLILKLLCQDPDERLASLREVGTAVVAFLVEYVAVFVVSKNLVEVEVASDTDDLPAGVTAAGIVAVAGVVFDYDYIVCVAVDVVVLAGYVVLFAVVAVGDLGVLAVTHVDA